MSMQPGLHNFEENDIQAQQELNQSIEEYRTARDEAIKDLEITSEEANDLTDLLSGNEKKGIEGIASKLEAFKKLAQTNPTLKDDLYVYENIFKQLETSSKQTDKEIITIKQALQALPTAYTGPKISYTAVSTIAYTDREDYNNQKTVVDTKQEELTTLQTIDVNTYITQQQEYIDQKKLVDDINKRITYLEGPTGIAALQDLIDTYEQTTQPDIKGKYGVDNPTNLQEILDNFDTLGAEHTGTVCQEIKQLQAKIKLKNLKGENTRDLENQLKEIKRTIKNDITAFAETTTQYQTNKDNITALKDELTKKTNALPAEKEKLEIIKQRITTNLQQSITEKQSELTSAQASLQTIANGIDEENGEAPKTNATNYANALSSQVKQSVQGITISGLDDFATMEEGSLNTILTALKLELDAKINVPNGIDTQETFVIGENEKTYITNMIKYIQALQQYQSSQTLLDQQDNNYKQLEQDIEGVYKDVRNAGVEVDPNDGDYMIDENKYKGVAPAYKTALSDYQALIVAQNKVETTSLSTNEECLVRNNITQQTTEEDE